MSIEIIVLDRERLEQIIEQTARSVADSLRDDLANARTPELMTKAELAEYLRCDISKINRYRQRLPVERFGGAPRFRKSDVDRCLKEGLLSDSRARGD